MSGSKRGRIFRRSSVIRRGRIVAWSLHRERRGHIVAWSLHRERCGRIVVSLHRGRRGQHQDEHDMVSERVPQTVVCLACIPPRVYTCTKKTVGAFRSGAGTGMGMAAEKATVSLPVSAMKLESTRATKLAPPMPTHDTNTMKKLANAQGRSPIEVGFTIYSVTKVDPVEQSFMCDLKIFCRWHDGGMDLDPDMVSLRDQGCFANGAKFERDAMGRYMHYVIKEIDSALVEHSRPHYQFTNAMEVAPVEGTLVTFLSPNDPPGWVRSEERFRGTFFQAMQLAAFPFDAQTLKLSLRLPRRSDFGRTFVQYSNSTGAQIEMKDWVRLAEWIRYEPTAQTSTDSKGRARYTISIPLVRRYQYYVWSILAVIASISFLAFVSFAIAPDDLPGRSSLVVTLLLTAVAFKLVISDILPKVRAEASPARVRTPVGPIARRGAHLHARFPPPPHATQVSYWTCMDYYINAMFLMLLLIAVENGCVGLVANRAPDFFLAHADKIEISTAAAVFVLWLVFHVWFIRYVIQVRQGQLATLDGLLMADEAAKERYKAMKQLQAERTGMTPKDAAPAPALISGPQGKKAGDYQRLGA